MYLFFASFLLLFLKYAAKVGAYFQKSGMSVCANPCQPLPPSVQVENSLFFIYFFAVDSRNKSVRMYRHVEVKKQGSMELRKYKGTTLMKQFSESI
jgi:hypothetical protein